MPALAEIDLVSDPDDLCHPLRSQMISLSDHPADLGEPFEAATLRAAQRVRLEVRNDQVHEIGYRPGLVLEGPIGPRLADPAALEEGLWILQQLTVSLVQRERERRAGLKPDPQLRTDCERDAEASFALPPDQSQTTDPTGARLHRRPLSLSEGRRIACHRFILTSSQDGTPLLSDQSLRGQGSLRAPRLPSGLPAAARAGRASPI
jgi:hypothetical protein